MWGSSSRVEASGGLRKVAFRCDPRCAVTRAARDLALRCAALVLLVVGYRFSFTPLHGVIGNPAFLVGLIPCLAAAVLLGLRGALVVVVVVQLIDRSFALSMSGSGDGSDRRSHRVAE